MKPLTYPVLNVTSDVMLVRIVQQPVPVVPKILTELTHQLVNVTMDISAKEKLFVLNVEVNVPPVLV